MVKEINVDGWLMNKNVRIARIVHNEVNPVHIDLLPYYLARGGDFLAWLESRAIDRHRINSRLLKRALRLSQASDPEIVLKVDGATITDNYWVQLDSNPTKSYEDVRFNKNYFDALALSGDPDSYNQVVRMNATSSRTPELTNTGSFEKCWRLENGQWWMYKKEKKEEAFSECFIAALGQSLGMDMAMYDQTSNGIKTKDFTDSAKVNFEEIWGLIGDEVDYEYVYDRLNDLSLDLGKAYLDLIFMDALIMNMDRHSHNYGVFRDVSTGKLLRMAPNYDNNIALIGNGYPQGIERQNDLNISDFRALIKGRGIDYTTPLLTEKMIIEAIEATPSDGIDTTYVKTFVQNGYDRLRDGLGVCHMHKI